MIRGQVVQAYQNKRLTRTAELWIQGESNHGLTRFSIISYSNLPDCGERDRDAVTCSSNNRIAYLRANDLS